jgi:hypothetical protein
MTYKYANFAESGLLTQLEAASTSCTIYFEDQDKFPALGAGEKFLCTLWDGIKVPEIVLVTAKASNVFTITRAQEGTSARQWDAGTMLRLAPTAAQFQEYWNALGGNGLVAIASANAATAFTGWNRRRGCGEITLAAGSWNLPLPTTATTGDEIMLSVVSAGGGTATVQFSGSTLFTLTALTDWKLVRWSGTAWRIVAGTSVGPTGAAGSNGAAGTNGTDAKTILSGTGDPGAGTGVNGDFYIKNPATAPVFFGPKAAGAWPSGVTMVGPSGPGSGDMLKTENLSGLASYPTARTNLGLGAAALLAVGTAAGTVAAGDDARFYGIIVSNFTADFTLALTDVGKLHRHTDAAAHSVTIPPNSTVAFPIGTVIPIRAYGAGIVTLIRGSGVELRSAGSATNTNIVLVQYDYSVLVKEDTNVWVLL